MERLLSLEEAAALVGYEVKAIRNLIFRGKFPHSKIGGLVRVDSRELEKFLQLSRKITAEQAAQKVSGTQDAAVQEVA